MFHDAQLLDQLNAHVRVLAVQFSTWANIVTPKQLSQQWNIGHDKAKKTLKVTTQWGTQMVTAHSKLVSGQMTGNFSTTGKSVSSGKTA
jgi:hypothetical protein